MPDNTELAAELAEALAKAEPLGDYGPRYILPRWPTDLMMDAGLRQLRLHRCSNCEEEGDDHNDLFSAWHDMVDAAVQGNAFTDPCLDVFDFLPTLLAEHAAMKARIAEMEGENVRMVKLIEQTLAAIDTGRSEPLFIMRDTLRNALGGSDAK